MGLIIGVGNTKPTFPYDYYYGIEWDSNVANSACTRVGRKELHVEQPIQNKMRRCLLDDEGKVVAYLHGTDSTKTDTGGTADLTGASGQVMVEIPQHYRKFEVNGTKFRCLLSEFPLPGFHLVPLAYRSAYQATVERSTSKLASVVNNTPDFRGGNNNGSWDELPKTQLGKPATVISLTNFRKFARNRGAAGLNGAGWNCDLYELNKTCFWLFAVEYANFNSQLPYNPEPTEEGYKQGGLGDGVTTLDYGKWSAFNGVYPVAPCGVTNSLGNRTGVVEYSLPKEYDAVIKVLQVPSFHGIENPFGNIWHWTDGCKCNMQSDAAGGRSLFFVCGDPSKFQDSNYNDYTLRGELPRREGYVKAMMVGEFGEIMPAEVGGSSSTYFADYFYTNVPADGESQRGVLFGGNANYGAQAGFVYANTNHGPANAGTNIGSRLCFLPDPATATR